MPLENFHLVLWVGDHFAGLPSVVIGGVGVLFLLLGAAALAFAFRLDPTSWSLALAGVGMLVLTYYVVGAAVSVGDAKNIGNAEVQESSHAGAAWAACCVCVGMGLFAGRFANSAWSAEGGGAKLSAVLLGCCLVALVFTGIQIARGGQYAPPTVAAGNHTPSAPGPVRPPKPRMRQ